MSVSCVGTCSNCGAKRLWLSDTLSLQMDDGQLTCLPHPGESGTCEEKGLTLAQASERGRLYRETFYVCRSCGKDGETIEKEIFEDWETLSVRGAMKWGWGAAAIVVPFLIWMRWLEGAAVIGISLLLTPAAYWWENRKTAKKLAARGFPRPDAPGQFPIAEPTAGCRDVDVMGAVLLPVSRTDAPGQSPIAAPTAGCRRETVIGQPPPAQAGEPRATGPCCDKPDWIEAFRVEDEDRVPCPICGHGIMVVSQHAIH